MALRQIVKRVGTPIESLFKKMSYPKALSRSAPIRGIAKSLEMVSMNERSHILKNSTLSWSNKSDIKSNTSKRYFSEAIMSNVFDIQDSKDFKKRVLNSHLPVIVDFYADWCGPCKLLVPKLETLISKNEGKLVLAKVNIEEQPEIAEEYEVMAVPTVLAVKNGKQIDKFVGFKNDEALELFIDKLV